MNTTESETRTVRSGDVAWAKCHTGTFAFNVKHVAGSIAECERAGEAYAMHCKRLHLVWKDADADSLPAEAVGNL